MHSLLLLLLVSSVPSPRSAGGPYTLLSQDSPGGHTLASPSQVLITPGRGSLFSDEAEVVSRRVVGTSQQCCFTLTGGCSEPWAPCSGLNHSSGSRSLTVEPGRQAAQRSSGRWHPVSRMRGLRHTGRLLTGDGEKRLWLGG